MFREFSTPTLRLHKLWLYRYLCTALYSRWNAVYCFIFQCYWILLPKMSVVFGFGAKVAKLLNSAFKTNHWLLKSICSPPKLYSQRISSQFSSISNNVFMIVVTNFEAIEDESKFFHIFKFN